MMQSMAEIMNIMACFDWSPLLITVMTAAAATLIMFIPAVLMARFVTGRKAGTKKIIDALMIIPMIIPPTAIGFLLLFLLGPDSNFVSAAYADPGQRQMRAWVGCVAAAVVVSFPILYRLTRHALEHIDKNTVAAASTLGIRKSVIFRKVVLPQARPGIAAGLILSFARAAGEYGATSILAGNAFESTGTVSIVIAGMIKNGDYLRAWIWVIVMLLAAFAILLILNVFADVRTSQKSGRKQKGGNK